MSRNSIEKKLRAILDDSKKRKFYVNVHSNAPSNRSEDYGPFDGTNFEEIDNVFTKVPNNIIVISFEKKGCTSISTTIDTKEHLNYLANNHWMSLNNRTELHNNARIYYPGDEIYNAPMSFAGGDFDIYNVPLKAKYENNIVEVKENPNERGGLGWVSWDGRVDGEPVVPYIKVRWIDVDKGEDIESDVISVEYVTFPEEYKAMSTTELQKMAYSSNWRKTQKKSDEMFPRSWLLDNISGVQKGKGMTIVYFFTCMPKISKEDYPENSKMIKAINRRNKKNMKDARDRYEQFTRAYVSPATRAITSSAEGSMPSVRPYYRRTNIKSHNKVDEFGGHGWKDEKGIWWPCYTACKGASWLEWAYDTCITEKGKKDCVKMPELNEAVPLPDEDNDLGGGRKRRRKTRKKNRRKKRTRKKRKRKRRRRITSRRR